MSRRAKVRLLSLLIVLTLWEFYGRRVNPISVYLSARDRACFHRSCPVG